MSTPIKSLSTSTTSLLRHPVDWLMVLSLLCSIPLLAVYCSDFWFRSDYRFFPLLIVTPFLLALWRGRQKDDGGRIAKSSVRNHSALALWLTGGVCAISAPLFFSPWLTVLAVAMAWIAWLLDRLPTISWPRLLKWTLPLWVLLLLPLADRSDPLPIFSSSVTYASSNLLDLLGIAHLPTEQTLQLRVGRYDVAAACHGLGNPYLLFTLALLLCMSSRSSLSLGFLTVATTPLWAWGGSVLLVVFSVWLAESQNIFLWLVPRLWIAQAVVLCGALLSVLFFKWGLHKLLAPFEAYSESVTGVHKFFNRVVLWPQPDPLRGRRSRPSNELFPEGQSIEERPWLIANSRYVWASVGILLLLGGGMASYRLTNNLSTWPTAMELLQHTRMSQQIIKEQLSQTTLPAKLFGATLVKFEKFATPGSTTGHLLSARWTYSNSTHTFELQAAAPFRGPAAMERQRLLDGSAVGDPLQTFAVQVVDEANSQDTSTPAAASTDTSAPDSSTPVANANANETTSDVSSTVQKSSGDLNGESGIARKTDRTVTGREMTLKDPVVGLTYLAYTNWPIDGSEQPPVDSLNGGVWNRILSSIIYQPTTASLSFWVAGDTPETDEQKVQWQQMLGRATELVQHALVEH